MGVSEIELDVTKPHRPSILEFSREISRAGGVKSVEITVTDMDMEIERVKIIVKGKDLSYEEIRRLIEDIGGAIQSVDRVVFER